MTLRCSDCDGEVGMLRVTRSVLRLGHRGSPNPIHPVRLARSGPERTHSVQGRSEGPATPRGAAKANAGPSSRPAPAASGRRGPLAAVSVRVTSRSQGSGVEPGSPRPGSATALSASSRS